MHTFGSISRKINIRVGSVRPSYSVKKSRDNEPVGFILHDEHFFNMAECKVCQEVKSCEIYFGIAADAKPFIVRIDDQIIFIDLIRRVIARTEMMWKNHSQHFAANPMNAVWSETWYDPEKKVVTARSEFIGVTR